MVLRLPHQPLDLIHSLDQRGPRHCTTATNAEIVLRRLKALSSTESAATAAAGGGDEPQQQYLRLPLESARKLRFYDRPDLNELVEQHTHDKAQLTAANAALRQV